MNATHKPIKVLLIEDDPEYAYLLQEMLATAGDAPFDLEHVDRLSAGVERLASGSIDVILLDLLLPDGRELDAFTRVHTQAPDVPIIVMSCLGDETLTVEVVREGAQDYLVKGQVDANSLARAIRYAIERKRAEEVLREQKDRAQKRLDIAGAMIVAIDVDQNVTLANKRSCEVLGYRDVEVVGKNWFDTFIPERIRDEVRNVFIKLMAGEIELVEHFENPVSTRDGEERIIAWRHTILRDENGNITNTLSSGEDITERKRAEEALRKAHDELERRVEERTAELTAANRRLQREVAERKRAEEALQESEEKLKAQYKGIPVPTYTWQRIGEDFVLINYNDAAEAITRGHIVDFVGRTAGQMYQEMPEILKDLQRCMVEQISIRREMPYRFQSTGEQKHLAVTYAFVPPNLVVVHTEDVTERKRAEEALQKAHDELELGIAERTAELTAANRMLRREITERKRAEQLLRALNQASLVMEKVLTPEEIFSAVAEELKRLGFSCAVFLTDESQSKLFPKYLSYGAGAIEVAEKLVGLKTETFSIPVEAVGIYRQGVWERQTVFVEDATGPTRQMLPGPLKKLAGQMVKILRVPKAINSPLIVEDKVIGLLSVQSDDLTEDDVPVITAFAHQMAAAWHRAQLFEQAQQEIAERRQVEEQLRESEKRYRTLYESSRDGIAATNLDGCIRECNQAFAGMLGYSREELERIRYQEITPTKWHALDEDVFREVMERGYSNEFEKEHIRKDGTVFPVSLRTWRVDDEADNPIGMWAIVRDVTERKQAEEMLKRRTRELATLYEAATAISSDLSLDAVLRTVAEQMTRAVNSSGCALSLWHRERDVVETLVDYDTAWSNETEPPGTTYALNDYSATRRVLETGEPTLIQRDDPTADEAEVVLMEEWGAFTLLMLPLIAHDRVWGLVELIDDVKARDYTTEEINLAESLAAQAAVAIENARLYEQAQQEIAERKRAEEAIQQQLEELIVLHAVATAGAEATDEDALIEHAMQAMDKMLNVASFEVMLIDEAADVWRIHPSRRGREHKERMTVPLGRGVVEQVAADGTFRYVPDVTREPTDPVPDPRKGSQLCVPLKAGERIIGVVNATSVRRNDFGEADERLLTTFAGQLATAIEKVRLMNTLEQQVANRTRELSALYQVTAVASESLELSTMLERSLEQVLQTVRCPTGDIRLLDETDVASAGESLYLAVQQRALPDSVAMADTEPSSSDLAAWVLEHNEPLVVSDTTSDPRVSQAVHTTRSHAYVGVPMRARGRIVGVLSVFGEPEQRFDPEEVSLLLSVADGVGVAVENIRLRQQAEQAAVMEERGRLARELHDSVTQSLYSLTLFAEWGQGLLQAGELEETNKRLNRIRETAQQALKEMRLLVYELRPATLEQDGLLIALQRRLDTVERRASVEASLVGPSVALSVPLKLEEELYRVAQEALNNSLKHAAASSVTVRVHADDKRVELEVIDDGVGFDPDVVNDKGGIGLSSMRERAERLGGVLEVISAPGKGTKVKIAVATDGS